MPRPLTPDLRRRLGLRATDERPYRWGFAAMVVALACAPLLLAGYTKVSLAVAVVALFVVPAQRRFERHQARLREQIYTDGLEAIGQVIAVEPPGPHDRERLIRVEFWARGARVETAVSGCRVARQGLGPGESVRLFYAADEPTRCLVLERAKSDIIDAV